MLSRDALRLALNSLARALEHPLTEDEVERLFQPIYEALGYSTPGRDIRGKRRGESGVPDVVLINSDGSLNVVVELKNPDEELADHEPQLQGYLAELKPSWALLSNGDWFWFYQRGRARPVPEPVSLEELQADPTPLFRLQKQTYDLQDFNTIQAKFTEYVENSIAPVNLTDVASQFFLDAFSLESQSPFSEFVSALYVLSLTLEQESRFYQGSYSFWHKFHARHLALADAPQSWLPFLPARSEPHLYQFMFILETAYVVTARLILAKAVQDKDARRLLVRDPLHVTVLAQLRARIHQRTGRVAFCDYASTISELFLAYSRSLFIGIFSEDIFDWWRDFDLANEQTNEQFGSATARLLMSVLKFNFAHLDGDLLGALYQSYFDPETRKALGEFYTPPELVDFILDRVGYAGTGRLLDPACGSGTFLVRALARYLNVNADRDPAQVLRGITEEFQLVGFDVNPFAVLMSEINVAALLVPLYAEAVARDPQIVLRRLPIIQTDSLRREFREGEAMHAGIQLGLDFGAREITVRVDLPVQQAGGEPLEIELTVPRLETAMHDGLVRNAREWLLMLQAMFAAIATCRSNSAAGLPEQSLTDSLLETLGSRFTEPERMAQVLLPHTEGIWNLVSYLREHHGDGRFLKTLEDVVLGLVLKHDLQYQYVVGNPPYVRIQNLPERQRRYWQNLYDWATGNFDIYIPFLERPLATDQPWLIDDGRMGYVISNSFLISEAAASMRRLFREAAHITSFTDFKAARFTDGNLFSDAMTYTCVMTAERRPSSPDGSFPVVRFCPRPVPTSRSDAIARAALAHSAILQTLPGGDDPEEVSIGGRVVADSFWQPNSILWERGWYFMPDDERSVFQHIEQFGTIRDPELEGVLNNLGFRTLINYTATESGGFAGVQTSLDNLMVLRVIDHDEHRGLVYAVPKGGGTAVWLEEVVTRRFLFGENVWRWAIDDENWIVLFPYFLHQNRYFFIPSAEYWDFQRSTGRRRGQANSRVFQAWPENAPRLEIDFPHLHAYVQAHETELRARENRRFVRGQRDEWRWYDLAYPRSLIEANAPKIVAQLLARSRQFAVDRDGSYLFQAGGKGGGVYGISPLRDDDLFFLLGCLNSTVADFYLRHITQFYNPSGSASYADAFLKFLPLAPVDDVGRDALVRSAENLSAAVERLTAVRRSISASPLSLFEHFRLGRSVEGEELGRQSDASNLPRQLSGTTARVATLPNGRAELRLGRGSLRLPAFLATLVLDVLNTRGGMARDELLATYFPTQQPDCELFSGVLREWRQEINDLEEEITAGEQAHDALVSAQYLIPEHWRPTIERFLFRF